MHQLNILTAAIGLAVTTSAISIYPVNQAGSIRIPNHTVSSQESTIDSEWENTLDMSLNDFFSTQQLLDFGMTYHFKIAYICRKSETQ